MRGYTAKKGNRYYAVIYEGVDPGTGKERRRWYSAGARKADADKLVTELVKRHHEGDYRARGTARPGRPSSVAIRRQTSGS